MVQGWRGSCGQPAEDAEEIRDELLRSIYGVWANRVFSDAVAYGGWAMDEHTPGGLRDLDKLPSRILNFNGIYTIPYRCYYSRNVDNLMMAGRDISASKMAFGTTRLMGTCSIGRQAVGTAAAMAVARGARLAAISAAEGCGPENVTNGVARRVGDAENCWQSMPLGPQGESITLSFDEAKIISQVRLTFDPDLTGELMPSLSRMVLERQVKGLPPQLVRDFRVDWLLDGAVVAAESVTGNAMRLRVLEKPALRPHF